MAKPMKRKMMSASQMKKAMSPAPARKGKAGKRGPVPPVVGKASAKNTKTKKPGVSTPKVPSKGVNKKGQKKPRTGKLGY